MALPFEVKLELKKGVNKMVAPLIPLVIAGVRIAAPIATRYLAGKISKKAAIKASQELAKKPAKSILQKGKEIIRGKPYQKEGKTFIDKQISKINKKNIGPNSKEFAKDVGRVYVGDKAFDATLDSGTALINRMKKGGMVKKCRMDGIALRGKTRAKERSK